MIEPTPVFLAGLLILALFGAACLGLGFDHEAAGR